MKRQTAQFTDKLLILSMLSLLLACVSTSLAQEGWQWKNPLPQGNHILGVQFISSNTVVAVAENGTILRSIDAGVTWNVRYAGTPASLSSVRFVNENIGFAVGYDGAIVKTTDGGMNWVQSPIVDANLLAVCFNDELVGTAVGQNGTILRTTDGGWNWTPQVSGTTNPLYAVSFYGQKVGIAAGVGGTILRTTNGGMDWIKQTSGTGNTLRSVLVVDENTSIAVGHVGTIRMTANGGTTWETRTSNTSADLYSVRYKTASTWFIVGNGILLKTTDRGSSWSNAGSVSGVDISFYNDAGVIVGNNGSILATSDGGNTWTQGRTGIPNYYLRDVAFASPSVAVAVGENVLFRSTDAGDTWTRILEATTTFTAVAFTDANRGYAMGSMGLERTTDAGRTWSYTDPGIVNTADVFFSDENTGTAVGDLIYRTTDAGNTWTLQGGREYHVVVAQMLTPQFGVAVAGDGVIRTTDGGVTWIELPCHPSSSSRFRGIFFSNENVGAVVGGGSGGATIAHTVDGGKTWTEQDYPEWPELNGVFFSGTKRGIAVGHAGIILLTTNGGDTWEQRPSSAAFELTDVHMTDSSTAIAVGDGGTILRSSDGGAKWTTIVSGVTPGPFYTDITFPTHDTGYVVPGMLKTTNGGLTWTSMNAPPGDAVFFVSPTKGFIPPYKTTDGGATWQSEIPWGDAISFADDSTGVVWDIHGACYRTTDGGVTWKFSPTTELTGSYRGVSFAGRDVGIAVGYYGIARTTNGGTLWTQVITSPPSSDVFSDVAMTDPTHAIAVGLGGKIMRTTDGGVTWFPLQSGTTETLTKVTFSDPLDGFIVGSYGAFLRTSDGGSTWARLRKIPAVGLNAISFRGPDLGIAVGNNGVILKTSNGGVTGIPPQPQSVPNTNTLWQNYPNPFNPSTKITFRVENSAFVSLRVFDLLGRQVSALVNEVLKPGSYERVFDASGLASGVYFYQLRSGSFVETRKLLLLR